jgi:hypothetical protein
MALEGLLRLESGYSQAPCGDKPTALYGRSITSAGERVVKQRDRKPKLADTDKVVAAVKRWNLHSGRSYAIRRLKRAPRLYAP